MGMFSTMSSEMLSAMKKQCENVLKKLEQLEAKGFEYIMAIFDKKGIIIKIDFITDEEESLDVKDKDLINLAEKTLAVPENRLTPGELIDNKMKKNFAEAPEEEGKIEMFCAMSSAMKKHCNNENILKKLEKLEAKGFEHIMAIIRDEKDINIEFFTEKQVSFDVKDKDLINLAEKTLAVPENRITLGELIDNKIKNDDEEKMGFCAMSSAMKKQCENVLKKLEQLEAKGFDHITAIIRDEKGILGDIDFITDDTDEEVRIYVKDKELIMAVPRNRKKCFGEEEKNEKRSKNLLNAALEGYEVSEKELNELTNEDLVTLAKKTLGI